MKRYLLLVSALMLLTNIAFADRLADQSVELAENGITGTTASGEPQTTVVDENGNLKMVPTDTSKKNTMPGTTSTNKSVRPKSPKPADANLPPPSPEGEPNGRNPNPTNVSK